MSANASDASTQTGGELPGYSSLSQRPLHVLFFLLPPVVLYEVFQPIYGDLGDGAGARDIIARGYIHEFFDLLGLPAQHVPMLLLVAVLLIWHLRRRDPVAFSPRLYGLMWAESLLWAVPLLLFALVWSRFALGPPAAGGGPAGADEAQIIHIPALARSLLDGEVAWQTRLVLDIGAGLYEELFFRLIGITLLHLLLVDYLGMKDASGTVAAMFATSAAFSLYHFGPDNPITPGAFAFYMAMGLLLGLIFVARGFGIVAAVHILYDMAESALRMWQGP